MGGPKGVKHSKGKGKSKSKKNDTSHKKTESLNSKLDAIETSNAKGHGFGDSKGKYTEDELVKCLYSKLDELYTKVKGWSLTSGHGMADVERALLNNGSCCGTYSSNEGSSVPDLSSIIQKVQSELNCRSLSKKVGILERINSKPALASKLKRDIPILRASLQRIIGTKLIEQQDLEDAGNAPLEGSNVVESDILTFLEEECVKRWQESSPNDPKTEIVIDLIESIRNLHKEVKVQKQWAQKKVTDTAKRLSKDLLELNLLRMEKMEAGCMKDEKLCAEKSSMQMLKETEQSLTNVDRQASIIIDTVKSIEASNAQIKADTEAIRLSESEYGAELNQVLQREMRCIKKLANTGKQISNLRANCDEEKQKMLQLQQDLFQAEEEAKEAEIKWRHEIKEKERTLSLLAEETRAARTHKPNLRAELLRLRRQIDTERNLKKDEMKRLEDELSRLQEMSDVSFLFEVALSVPYESSRHWNCMICLTNEVSVVFLPCSHQVVCSGCSAGGRCPYCSAEIEQSIKVYGPT